MARLAGRRRTTASPKRSDCTTLRVTTPLIACLAHWQALKNTLSLPRTGGESEKGRVIEKTTVEILQHYERMNRAVRRDRDAAVKLLRERMNAGRPDVTREACCFLSASCLFDVFVPDHGVDVSHSYVWGRRENRSQSRRVQGSRRCAPAQLASLLASDDGFARGGASISQGICCCGSHTINGEPRLRSWGFLGLTFLHCRR